MKIITLDNLKSFLEKLRTHFTTKKLEVSDEISLLPSVEEKTFSISYNSGVSFKSTTGTVGNFYIDASSSVFTCRTADIQINSGTKIYILDQGSGTITFNNYKDSNYAVTMKYTDSSGNEVTFSDTTKVINTSSMQKTVLNDNTYYLLEATNSKYFYSITYNCSIEIPTITGTSSSINFNSKVNASNIDATTININNSLNSGLEQTDFSNSWTVSEFYENNVTYTSTTGTYNGLYIDATNGKFEKNNSSWHHIKAVTILYIPCAGNGTLSTTWYYSSKTITCGNGNFTTADQTSISYAFTEDELVTLNDTTYLKLTVSDENYISNITVNYTTDAYSIHLDKDGITSKNLNVQNMISEVDFQQGIKYKGETVLFVKKLTQTEYDALETKDDNIFYIIED